VARIGLVRFARVALAAAEAAVPRYRTRFSKHTFTQPQLLALVCLMRYDDWTFRDVEVRLAEHAELRRALRLGHVPHHTTVLRFLERTDPAMFDAVLAEIVRRFPPDEPPPRGRRRARPLSLLIDATGLNPGKLSSYFLLREQDVTGRPRRRGWWLKWLLVIDADRQLILTQRALIGPRNDSRRVPELLADPLVQAAAHAAGGVAWVLADREFDSEANHVAVRQCFGRAARSAIALQRATTRGACTPFRQQMLRALPGAYRRRALAETVFSVVKRVLGGTVAGRSFHMRAQQARALGVAYNLYRLKPAA
jgi:hypothetical protein